MERPSDFLEKVPLAGVLPFEARLAYYNAAAYRYLSKVSSEMMKRYEKDGSVAPLQKVCDLPSLPWDFQKYPEPKETDTYLVLEVIKKSDGLFVAYSSNTAEDIPSEGKMTIPDFQDHYYLGYFGQPSYVTIKNRDQSVDKNQINKLIATFGSDLNLNII